MFNCDNFDTYSVYTCTYTCMWTCITYEHSLYQQPVILTGTNLVTPALRWTLPYLEVNMGSAKHTVYISKTRSFMYYDEKKVHVHVHVSMQVHVHVHVYTVLVTQTHTLILSFIFLLYWKYKCLTNTGHNPEPGPHMYIVHTHTHIHVYLHHRSFMHTCTYCR